MTDMSVSSSRQFAGIHTQLDKPPRLALSLLSFLTCSAAETGLMLFSSFFEQTLSNYSDQKWKHT